MLIRNKLKSQFSQIPNNLLLDNRLSNGAKIVMCYLLSLPDGWTINNKDVMNKLDIKQESTLTKYWKQLINLGWITRQRKHTSKGHFDNFEYILHNDLTVDKHGLVHNDLTVVLPLVEKPLSGKNNELNNTKEQEHTNNTNKKNTNNGFKKFNYEEVKQFVKNKLPQHTLTEDQLGIFSQWMIQRSQDHKKCLVNEKSIQRQLNKLLEFQKHCSIDSMLDRVMDGNDQGVYQNIIQVEQRYKRQDEPEPVQLYGAF